jgi:hypothetical protein
MAYHRSGTPTARGAVPRRLTYLGSESSSSATPICLMTSIIAECGRSISVTSRTRPLRSYQLLHHAVQAGLVELRGDHCRSTNFALPGAFDVGAGQYRADERKQVHHLRAHGVAADRAVERDLAAQLGLELAAVGAEHGADQTGSSHGHPPSRPPGRY